MPRPPSQALIYCRCGARLRCARQALSLAVHFVAHGPASPRHTPQWTAPKMSVAPCSVGVELSNHLKGKKIGHSSVAAVTNSGSKPANTDTHWCQLWHPIRSAVRIYPTIISSKDLDPSKQTPAKQPFVPRKCSAHGSCNLKGPSAQIAGTL